MNIARILFNLFINEETSNMLLLSFKEELKMPHIQIRNAEMNSQQMKKSSIQGQ